MTKPAAALICIVVLTACDGAKPPTPAAAVSIPSPPIVAPHSAPSPGLSLVSPTHPEEIFSNAELRPEDEAAIKAAGFTGDLTEINAHLSDKMGWPKALADEETRNFHWDMLKQYKMEKLASFRFYGHDAVLVRIPARENQHMPPDWRLDVDFFILFDAQAFAN